MGRNTIKYDKLCSLCREPTESWPIKSLNKDHAMSLELAPDYRAFRRRFWHRLKNKMVSRIICAKCLRIKEVYQQVMSLPTKPTE